MWIHPNLLALFILTLGSATVAVLAWLATLLARLLRSLPERNEDMFWTEVTLC